MSVIGVFCRPNHPAGYASWPPGTDAAALERLRQQYQENAGGVINFLGAHGYVTWIVVCDDWVQLHAVRDLLRKGSTWADRQDPWYSGPLDMVTAWEGAVFRRVDHNGALVDNVSTDWRSIGDNRAAAWMLASELLAGRVCSCATGMKYHALNCPVAPGAER